MTPAAAATGEPLLAMRGVRKSFGGIEVLKGVDFEAVAGEVHALVGENGAGKSTLMGILAGVLRPDTGTVRLGGVEHRGFASAHAAQQAGVAMVFQERSLFAPLSVAENIFAGRQPVTRWGLIDRRRLRAEAAALLAQVAPDVAADTVVGELSPAQQQMVEIAKALSLRARLIILDEPTAALTEAETARLFAVIRQLQGRGVAVAYISHRLEELFGLADRVTVLKDGAVQGTLPLAATDTGELVRLMVGRDVAPAHRGAAGERAPMRLDVRGLSDPETVPGGRPLLRDVTLHVRAGEIVGLAGLAGAGRTELALSLFGARPRGAGDVWLNNRALAARSPAQAIAAGLGYVSEDRKESGLFPDLSVARNIAVARLGRFGSWFYRDREEAAVADEFRAQLRIAGRGAQQDVGHLSGGNQQKVLLARWLLVNPRVLIVDEPTRGVDVGAKAEVHALLHEFARQGGAVLAISSDLPEVLTVSDRIYVLRQGRVAGELARHEASEEAVMRLATLHLPN